MKSISEKEIEEFEAERGSELEGISYEEYQAELLAEYEAEVQADLAQERR